MPDYPSGNASLFAVHARRCPHRNRVGDNYGETYLDCGERMSGYGYYASQSDCKHVFSPAGDGAEICIYCEQVRYSDCCCYEIAGDNDDCPIHGRKHA